MTTSTDEWGGMNAKQLFELGQRMAKDLHADHLSVERRRDYIVEISLRKKIMGYPVECFALGFQSYIDEIEAEKARREVQASAIREIVERVI